LIATISRAMEIKSNGLNATKRTSIKMAENKCVGNGQPKGRTRGKRGQ